MVMNIEQIGAQYSRKLEKKIHWKIQIKISIILSICFTEIQSNLSQGRNRNRSTWNHLNPSSSNRVWTRVAWLIERCSFPRILHCNAAKRLSFLFEIGAVHFLWNDFVHLRRPSRISFFSPRILARASLHLSISFSFQHLVPSLARIRVKGGSGEKGTSLALDKDKKKTIGRGSARERGKSFRIFLYRNIDYSL